jgi:hypothetical protein
MRRVHYVSSAAEVTIVNALTATTDVTAGDTFGAVPASWGGIDAGIVSEFDLVLWSAGTVTITNLELFAAVQKAGSIVADDLESVSTGADTMTLTAHGHHTGDGPWQMTTTGAVPGGLALLTDYWSIRSTANAIKVAASLADAMAGTAIDLTSAGSGTNTITGTASAKRTRWVSQGVVTASLALALRTGMVSRFKHHPLATAYGVKGTWGSAVAASVNLVPVSEK